jgi:hypothetical protein
MRALAVGATFLAVITMSSSLGGCARSGAQPILVVQGRIVYVKPNWMMLNNGTQIIVPADVVRWSELTEGATVTVQYEERNGQKVATSMRFLEGFPGQRGL